LIDRLSSSSSQSASSGALSRGSDISAIELPASPAAEHTALAAGRDERAGLLARAAEEGGSSSGGGGGSGGGGSGSGSGSGR
jgi:hypothetical protein